MCKRNKSYFTNFTKRMQNAEPPTWLQIMTDEYGFRITGQPSLDEANIGVAIQDVVGFLAR